MYWFFLSNEENKSSGPEADQGAEVEMDILGGDQALGFSMGREHGQCHNHSTEVMPLW